MTRRPSTSTLFPYTTLFRSIVISPRVMPGPRGATFEHEPIAFGARYGVGGHRRPSVTNRSEEHTSELQSRRDLVCRLLLEKKNQPRQLRVGYRGATIRGARF